MLKVIFLSFTTILIVGCATTTTGPTPAGESKYVMSRQEGAFPSGDEPLLQEVLEIKGVGDK